MSSKLLVDDIVEKTSGMASRFGASSSNRGSADIGGAAASRLTSTSSVTSNKSATITPKYSNSKIIIHVTLGMWQIQIVMLERALLFVEEPLLANLTSRHVYNAPGGGVALVLGTLDILVFGLIHRQQPDNGHFKAFSSSGDNSHVVQR